MPPVFRTAFVCALLMGCCLDRSCAQVTSTWNNTTGNWSDATRWSTNPLFPNNGNGGNDYNAIINGGTVTLDQDIEIDGLTLGGGTIDGSFDLDLNAASAWSAGTLAGTGVLSIASDGTLAISGGVTKNLNRSLVNDGTMTWTANNVANNLSMSSSILQNNGLFTANINLGGTVSASGGTNAFNNNGSYSKLGTGTAQFTGVAFNNSGTVGVQAGTLTLAGGGSHSGDFTGVAGSTLDLAGNHTFAASSDLSGGLNIRFGSGTTQIDGTFATTGTATFAEGTTTINGVLSATSLSFVDTGQINGSLIGTGAATFTGNTTINGPLTVSALNVDGTARLNGTLNAPGGTLGGTFTGTADWNVTNTLNWTTGTMSGTGTTTIGSGGTLTLSGASFSGAQRTLSRNLVNNGTINWTNTISSAITNATIQNNGTFTSSVSSFHSLNSINGIINNAGTFIQQTGDALIYATFNNSGSVQVQAGTLHLLAGGTHTGDFTGTSGATLSLSGNHNFSATSDITGGMNVNFASTGVYDGTVNTSGAVTISGGTNSFNGNFTVSSLNLSGGTATFNNSLNVSNAEISSGEIIVNSNWNVSTLNWSGGTMSGSGTTFVNAGSLTGLGKRLNNRTLRMTGDVNWTDGHILADNTTSLGTIHIANGSTLTIVGRPLRRIQANLQIDAGGTLVHTGLPGSFTQHEAGTFVNNGLVQVDAGTLAFNSGGTGNGEFYVAPGAILQFNGPGHNYSGGVTLNNSVFKLTTFELTNGTVQGTGTIDALTFTNSSNVAPGLSLGNAIGTFSITGDYAQTSDGNLSVDIEDGSTFDTLNIVGDANLGGTLTLILPDDGSIQAGDTFDIITAGDILGTEFDEVITEGTDDLNVFPIYEFDRVAALIADEGDLNPFIPGLGDDDVAAFALALTNPNNYRSQFGASAKSAGDIDNDGDCDVDDIDDFADIMQISLLQLTYQMQLALAVPEPTLGTYLLGLLLLPHRLGRCRGRFDSFSGLRTSIRGLS